MPKPTIVRLLDTLIALGYVVNDRRQGGYQVTSLVRSLSAGFHGDPLVVEAARPWAIAFTRKYQWPVAVAVLDRDAVAVRFSTIPDSPVSPFHATINMRLQLMSRALGRAYIAFCPPGERNLLLRMLAASDDPEDAVARDRAAALTLAGHDPARGLCRSLGHGGAEVVLDARGSGDAGAQSARHRRRDVLHLGDPQGRGHRAICAAAEGDGAEYPDQRRSAQGAERAGGGCASYSVGRNGGTFRGRRPWRFHCRSRKDTIERRHRFEQWRKRS